MELRKSLKFESILGDGRKLTIESQEGCYDFIIDGKCVVLDYFDLLEMVRFIGFDDFENKTL